MIKFTSLENIISFKIIETSNIIWLDIILLISQIIISIGAIFGIFLSIYQIKKYNRSNNINLILLIESNLNQRGKELDEINFQIEMMTIKREMNSEKSKMFIKKLDSCEERFLNSLDRLAFCILKNYLPGKDWKSEYQQVFKNIYEEWKGFDDEIYKNIKKLYCIWECK